MPDNTETLAALLRRYCDQNDEPRVSLADAVRRGDDPLLVNEDESEEEIHSFRVAEGVAVTVASDGLWLLFEP